MAENINNGFVLFTEGEISDFIDSTDAANTKKQIKFAVQRLESFAQLVDADLVDISEPDLDKKTNRHLHLSCT